MKQFRELLEEKEGVSLIWVTVMLMVFVAFVGLALDTGYAVWVGPRLGSSGAAMDQWIAPAPGTEIQIALALAAEVAKLRKADLGAFAGRVKAFSAAKLGQGT